MASVLNVSATAIAITGLADTTARRHLAAQTSSGVSVAFSITTASASAASALASSITATNWASLVSVLNSSGLTACTGIIMSAPRVISLAFMNVSAVNASAVTQAISTAFANLTVDEVASRQGAILSNLNASAAAVNLTATAAETTAHLVLAVVTAAPNITLTLDSQNTALSILSTVAVAPMNVTSSVAQSITSALSAVATSAVTTNPTALVQVQTVLTTLTSNQASSIAAAMAALPAGSLPEPAVTSSPTIQTLVQVDPPGSNRLTTQPLTAPGSPSKFEPLPADLLAGASGNVVTTFLSLAFDPYASLSSGNATNASTAANVTFATTGVTRLAFSNPDGSAIEVANASTPVRFTLPRVNTSGDAQAVCSFWDTAVQKYSTHGCIGVPSPGPPNHTLAFVPGFMAPNDASLALAWNISGPLVDDGSCRVAVLDCNVEPNRKIYPDNRQPLSVPAVSCPPVANGTNATRPVLRVFYGTDCQLWQDNALNCSWDNIKQAFVGGGCVPTGNATQCMCRHLTDFASARTPKIATCSLSDMMALSPGDLITKLKFLFIVVMSLFSVMNVGAIIAFFLDVQERRATIAKLLQPEMGFDELVGGVWTWRCVQEPLTRAVAAPAGSAMHLASVLGLPFVRLRAAIPECAFAGSVGQALGRREGLSVNGLIEARDENVAVMTQLLQALSCCGMSRERIPAFSADDDSTRKDENGKSLAPQDSTTHNMLASAPEVHTIDAGTELRHNLSIMRHADEESDATAESLIGTALVFAFLANAKVLPVVEYARRFAAASAHFAGMKVHGIDRDFEALHAMFVVMLSAGNLTGRTDWLEKSRLWRFILLQRADGGWDMNGSLAFALQAHEGARPPPKPPQSRIRSIITMLLGEDDFDDALDDALDDAMTSSDDEERDEAGMRAHGDAATVRHVKDCPLTFTEAAVRHRMPPALAALNQEYEAALAEARAAKAAEQARLEAERTAAELRRRKAEEAAQQAMREAVAAAVHVQGLAPGQLNTPAALQSWVDGAIAALQHKLESLRESASAPQEEPHVKRQQKLLRSFSRKLERLQTVKVALQQSSMTLSTTPASPLTLTSSATRTRRPRHARVRVPVERIWATILAVNVLEELDSCWQCDEEDETMRTIVDNGHEYLRAQGRADRRVRKLLKSHAMESAAERARRDWKAIQAANVAALRETDVINRFTALTHVQRASARIVRSMMVDHGTFATFLDTDGYIMRWQARARFPRRREQAYLRRADAQAPAMAALHDPHHACVDHAADKHLVRCCCCCMRRRYATLLTPLTLLHFVQVLLLPRCQLLHRDPHHPELRPDGAVPGLRGRLRGVRDAVRGRAGLVRVFGRPGRAAHGARVHRRLWCVLARTREIISLC